MKLMTIPVANLRYRWQCDPEGDAEKNALLLRHSQVTEMWLFDIGFQNGLIVGGAYKIIELYENIRTHGIRDPFVVYTTDDPNVYRVDLGNQRLAIARALGIKEVKCEVY